MSFILSLPASASFSVNKRLALKLPPPPIKVCGRLKGIHAVSGSEPLHTCTQHTHTHPSWCFCYPPWNSGYVVKSQSSWIFRPLCVGQCVPVGDLLPLRLLHLCPVGLLVLASAVEAQGDAAQPLPGPHAAPPAEHRQHQRHLGQLEERHLEQEGLLVGGVGLPAAHGSLTLGHLLPLGVQHGQLHVGVWKRAGRESHPVEGYQYCNKLKQRV